MAAPIDQKDTHYPRHSNDVISVFNILKQWLPSEIVLEVLDYAEYWLLSRISRADEMQYEERDCHGQPPYLTSAPIQGERYPVRKIQITIWSHDQGWSSYPQDHGSFNNSWTWFDLSIARPPGRDDISKDANLRLATNVHASKKTMCHEIIYHRDQNLRWVRNLQPGDRISIIPRALYPGWRNFVEKACIEIYTTPILT
ncbi:hypothetical protein BDV32DRAFT_121378 [Aspergillus pseudonomiae]|uniref:Uncharacterized protein n=1 Tax=Aspergillus pseudonomiae TaxID=1506151 RepID=A0A5N7D159_9EURO|nr:uncharacterized protein BDV37DRAFT_258659 [Aspergillus pseudonomiae]KAB8261451.1 hypothetical protein BDV32DRAFT_121378 [Aspergillus pseudonomiae]KAE8400114.1 hypothetical protein BDV37DRAFT_258659 [Aspergillus pseudonomiae]